MRRNETYARRAGRLVALAGTLLASTAALAGGPLELVDLGGAMQPARWEGTVKVWLDKGPLSTRCTERDENWNCLATEELLSEQAGDDLVAASVAQWSSVPTSSFRATVAGRSPVDITGANIGSVLGAYNGGGIQVIYDADGSVIAALTGGNGYGVLGIASPEMLAGQGSTRIVEGWLIVGGAWLEVTDSGPISGVVTHEMGHAINLAHSQTNGYYARNAPAPEFGVPRGPDQAGPDQCGVAIDRYPTADEIETMYPLVNPYADSPRYNSPAMATVDVADDMAALSSLYPAPGYQAATGTLKGKVVAKDGTSPVTGINVIARRVDSGGNPFSGAISRISGDLTQGRLGADGRFVMTGLVPGASYVVYIDELATGSFSTPKSILLGPEEYWNADESGDARKDDACVATTLSLAAGEVRQITIAVNGVPNAPTFTHIPYALSSAVSDDGSRVVGVHGNLAAPYWVWDHRTGVTEIGGEGFLGAISGDGRVAGGSIPVRIDSEWGPLVQEQPALWTGATGWKSIAPDGAGCGLYQATIFDLSRDGTTAVGNYWTGCGTEDVYAWVWNAKTGHRLLPKARKGKTCPYSDGSGTFVCEGDARVNAVSADGRVFGGFESFPELGARVGAIWRGRELMLLRDPKGKNPFNGWAGEVMAMNAKGTIAVGGQIGPEALEAYMWRAGEGVKPLGRFPGRFCQLDDNLQTVCVDVQRETAANSVSDDGHVVLGGSFGEAVIWTPRMGWMLLSEFLERQGVLEASRWFLLGGFVSGNGTAIAGTAIPLAADYYHAFHVDLKRVYVCAGKGTRARTLSVAFPDGMDRWLAWGATVGLCPGDAPL
ncbi:MAG: hypothetical protein U1F08_03905 [Steroidobacteraceae bacterium]